MAAALAELPGGVMLAGVGFSIASAVLYGAFTLVSGRLSQRLGAGPMTTCLTIVAAVVMGLSSFVPATRVAGRGRARGLAAVPRCGDRGARAARVQLGRGTV